MHPSFALFLILEEGVGFEPTDLSVNGFQDRRLKPLGQPSSKGQIEIGVRLYGFSLRLHKCPFLAETKGFEPLGLAPFPLAGECLKPLGHVSGLNARKSRSPGEKALDGHHETRQSFSSRLHSQRRYSDSGAENKLYRP